MELCNDEEILGLGEESSNKSLLTWVRDLLGLESNKGSILLGIITSERRIRGDEW